MQQLDITAHLGDCLEVMPTLEPASFDLILCDPPQKKVRCAWDQIIPFAPMWEQVKRLLAPGGGVVLFANQPYTADLLSSNRKWFRYSLVWEKAKASGFLNANRQPLRAHEDILVFSPSAPPYHPQKSAGKPYSLRPRKDFGENGVYGAMPPQTRRIESLDGTRFPRSVMRFGNAEAEPGYRRINGTQKPTALLEHLILTYSAEGARVLDFAAGSFSTGVAAIRAGRHFTGIEREGASFRAGADWLGEEVDKWYADQRKAARAARAVA
jgi:DNA modification methylase